MITRKEAIKRLESVSLPDIVLEDHRRELRASLLAEYGRRRLPARTMLLSQIWSSTRNWKTIAVTSAVWVVIAVVITLLVIIPASLPSSTAMAIDAVMADSQVRAFMVGDEMESITVMPTEGGVLEVMVEGRGGAIIIASVNVRNGTVTITEITYIAMLGSIFEPEERITGDAADKVIAVASTDREFRQLLDKGAVVDKVVAIQTIVSRRHTDTGETTEERERWAMVTMALDGKQWYFLVDPLGSRVINRSTIPIP